MKTTLGFVSDAGFASAADKKGVVIRPASEADLINEEILLFFLL